MGRVRNEHTECVRVRTRTTVHGLYEVQKPSNHTTLGACSQLCVLAKIFISHEDGLPTAQ